MSRYEAMFPNCGSECTQCKMICRRADAVDSDYASRLAFMLECMIVDHHGHWNQACELLDQYKAEWQKINPGPPTFMGEPVPPERMERYKKAMTVRAKGNL